MDIEDKIKAFIGDIPDLKKSKNITKNKIWSGQVSEFLNQLNLSGTDVYQMNTVLSALENSSYTDPSYDNAELFLKLLMRKGLIVKPKVVTASSTKLISQTTTPMSDTISRIIKAREESEPQRFIPLIEGIPTIVKPKVQTTQNTKLNKIFIVHGHDNESKLELARILEKMGLEPIILHEQPNQGRTIMEKFEEYSKDVNFAFVLLTPDDLGGTDKSALKKRARQNVILELGFFIGKLGRSRVCCLHKSEVELPTDYLGVTYLPFVNSPKECYEEIMRELKTAGFSLKL